MRILNGYKEIPLESQQSVYLSRVFGYLRGHETTAWLALFIGVVVGIAFGLGLLVFVSLLKKRLKGKRSTSRCLGDNMVIQQEITCLQDDVIFRRSNSNFSFWHDVSDCTEDRHPRSSRQESLNAANMASIFASNPVASKPNTNKSAPVTFALVEHNYSPMICDEMRVKLNQVSLDVLTGTSQTHVFT